jgi:hypothetical protein
VAGLVGLLSSSNSDVQEKAAGALLTLALDCLANKVLTGEYPGAVAGLVGLLSSSNSDVQENAAGALRTLAFDCPANKVLIGEYPGAVAGLVGLLSSSNNRMCRRKQQGHFGIWLLTAQPTKCA